MSAAPEDAPRPARPRAVPTGAAVGAIAALGVFGLARAFDLAWICDDAFVSLRYAENLALGHGLVYNVGERVEGYTNLLWTLALAAGSAGGAAPEALAKQLGIVAYAGLVLTLVGASFLRHRRQGLAFVPLAAGVVLIADDFHQWATGGLETMLFAWLATAGLLLTRGRATKARAAAAGVCLSLLVLTRPDGVLFAAAGIASWWLPPRRLPARDRIGRTLASALPIALTGALLVVWKLSYYGELLPTAFYSKSVLQPYWGQGLVYLGLFLAKSWWLPIALVGAAVLWWRRSADDERGDADDLFLLGSATVYLVYVVHVGGDFMFARRIVPAIPLVLIALEGCILRRAGHPLLWTAACLVGAALPFPVFSDESPRIRGVADERRFYPDGALVQRRAQAHAVASALEGTPARVMFEGGMCSFGYYSGLPYLVEMTGLTQYSLAKLPLSSRGWIGHEKRPTDAWIHDHRVHLIVGHDFPPIDVPERLRADQLYFGRTAVARITLYDDRVMDRLREIPQVHFVPIEDELARRRRQLERANPEEAARILERLDRFYFRSGTQKARAAERELRALVN